MKELKDLRITIDSMSLAYPVMNAAGTCRSLEEVKKLAEADIAAIMVGSITMLPREGNAGTVWYPADGYSLNSIGLRNRGWDYYQEHLPRMVEIANANTKPLFVSVVGFAPDEYAMLTENAFKSGADLVELNLGCPNIWDEGKQKRIISFDPEAITHVLQTVKRVVTLGARVSIKVSPYSDPIALQECISAILDHPWVKLITSSNTFPNASEYEDDKLVIDAANGFAGMAGKALKPIALGQVRQIKQVIEKRHTQVSIIGVGGITCGKDVQDYLSAGAQLTQVATAYSRSEDRKVFSSILMEMLE